MRANARRRKIRDKTPVVAPTCLDVGWGNVYYRSTPDLKPICYSPDWWRAMKLTWKDVEGHNWLKLVHPDDAGWMFQMRLAVLNAKPRLVQTEIRTLDPQGAWRPAISRAVPDLAPNGRLLGWRGELHYLIDGDRRAHTGPHACECSPLCAADGRVRQPDARRLPVITSST